MIANEFPKSNWSISLLLRIFRNKCSTIPSDFHSVFRAKSCSQGRPVFREMEPAHLPDTSTMTSTVQSFRPLQRYRFGSGSGCDTTHLTEVESNTATRYRSIWDLRDTNDKVPEKDKPVLSWRRQASVNTSLFGSKASHLRQIRLSRITGLRRMSLVHGQQRDGRCHSDRCPTDRWKMKWFGLRDNKNNRRNGREGLHSMTRNCN